MKDTLSEINELRAAGLIGQWAIGGAMGATYFLERHGLASAWLRFEQNYLNRP
jgi:hypothetical protein